MKLLFFVILQAGIEASAMAATNWEKIGFLGAALLAVIVLWRKQEKSDAKYSALLERVINIENNSTKALEGVTEAIDKMSAIIEKKVN